MLQATVDETGRSWQKVGNGVDKNVLTVKNLPRQKVFVCFVVLPPKSTAMVIGGWSVHLTTPLPG